MVALKHIALLVPDLRQAEEHYTTIFAADLIGREALLDDQRWYSAPNGSTWEEIEAAGIEISWVGLRRDDLIIALLRGEPAPDRTLFCIGLTVTPAEVAEIRERLPDNVTVELDQPTEVTFIDRHGFRWQCAGPGFDTAGVVRGDWLEL